MTVHHCECGAKWDDDNDTHNCPLAPKKSKKKGKKKVEPEPDEPDLREDLRGQADQIHDLLEIYASMTYEEIGQKLNPPVSPKRASRLIGQMIRDGVDLVREGVPRKVSLA